MPQVEHSCRLCSAACAVKHPLQVFAISSASLLEETDQNRCYSWDEKIHLAEDRKADGADKAQVDRSLHPSNSSVICKVSLLSVTSSARLLCSLTLWQKQLALKSTPCVCGSIRKERLCVSPA